MRPSLSSLLAMLAACPLLGLLPAGQLGAAEPQLGPVVEHHGPVYAVPEGSFNLDAAQAYKVVMDIGKGPDDPAQLNRSIESAARFLNLHARHGIDPGKLELAVVLHGSGARAALDEEAHQRLFSVPNPNRSLLAELGNAGVGIYLCGQTAAYYDYAPDNLLPQVTMAVSAMTVHVRLQQEGYRAILF
jgi:intracellular sulfur oxidation DsrE/DsrF family protein